MDAIEQLFLPVSRSHAKHVMQYRGDLDEDALSRAFQALCARHAVLRARVREDGNGYLLHVPDDVYPEFVAIDGDLSTLQREVWDNWNAGDALALLMVVRGESQGYVRFAMSHVIGDGSAYLTLCHELWQLYTDIVNGRDVAVEMLESLPCAPSDLIRTRWVEKPDYDESEPVTEARDGFLQRIRFRDASRLVAAARTQQTSVGAIVSGATAIALRDHESSSEAVPVKFINGVNLRKHVVPTVGALETTNFLGAHVDTLNIAPGDDAVTVAKEFRRKLSLAIERRTLFVAGLSTQEKYLQRSSIDMWVDNGGNMPAFAILTI